jgi:TolB-like protein
MAQTKFIMFLSILLMLFVQDALCGIRGNRLVVLEFKPVIVDVSNAAIITEQIREEIARSNRYEFIDRKSMETALMEQGIRLGDCMEASCAVEIGLILNARWVVAGSLSRLEDNFIVRADIIDVESGTAVKSATEEAPKMPDAIRLRSKIVQTLCSEPKSAPVPAEPKAQPQPTHVVHVAPPKTESEKQLEQDKIKYLMKDITDLYIEIKKNPQNEISLYKQMLPKLSMLKDCYFRLGDTERVNTVQAQISQIELKCGSK